MEDLHHTLAECLAGPHPPDGWTAEPEHGEPGYMAEETPKQGVEGAPGFFLWR